MKSKEFNNFNENDLLVTKLEKTFSTKKKGNIKTFKIKNLLLKGVPGTGKSRAIENIINNKLELKDHKENILRINIHSASSNADLMQGIGISSKYGQIEYKEKQGLILNLIQRATFNPNQPFVLILEEIQENSLNELIGDLIYLIEEDKRAKNIVADDEEYGYQELVEKIVADNPETAYVEIPYLVNDSTEYRKMIMPNNLYIFCTSNYRDDKKVIEDNLLRRFEVLEIYPKVEVVHEYCKEFFSKLNENILEVMSDEIHPDRFLIGHSNWLKVENQEAFYRAFLKVVVEFKDIKEVDFSDFKEIVEKLPLVDALDLSSYKALIEDLQTKAGYDFLD
jgi:DNA polymerase III delta prime subunit